MLSVVAALLPVVTYEAEASSYTMQTTAIYTDETCSGPAVNILVIDNDNCSAMACSPQPSGNSNFYKATTCYSTDSLSYNPMEDLFLGQTFIEILAYSNINCTDDAYLYRHGLIVGSCEPFSTRNNHSVSVTLESDGSATILLYNNTECTDPLVTTYALSNYTLVNHHCYEGISSTELAQYTARYYVHLDYDSAGESEADSNFAAIVGGIVAVFVVVLAVAAFIVRCRNRRRQFNRARHRQ
ncbi:hypothetical protein L917_20568 [Phytophthora nicotianae]|uniref:Uncharacterized protein n=4 Tax=Phytophthora nicotianae TaxID=4792 RepID=V9E022_PHYNI|nr:hypothetical protein F443_21423 [Phytophthora nicotianae P1569]ETL78657.1 hypothetical protein L917_20568 [Phytophthora nicotianae]ETM31919.1 hypothetical protein L914_20584 [Phytophthora nicotianae]ETO60361.1 hypothetical protein F444_21441 [Phytophthora nicotianae P1976]